MQQQQFINAFLSLVLILMSSSMVSGQVFRPGSCPSGVQTVGDFKVKEYLGTWYEYAKYPFIFEAGGRCIQADYGAYSDTQITVNNTNINARNIQQSIEGLAKIVAPGKLSVRFNGFASLGGAADYWVLGTDYTNYAVVYSCRSFLILHTEVIWILTRQRNPSADSIKAAKDVITAQNLSLKELQMTNQVNCS